MATRHVIEKFADNNPERLKCVKARFTKHVFPGDEVQTEMWKISPTRIVFQLRVLGRDDIAIGNAFVELYPEDQLKSKKQDEPKMESASSSAGGKAAEIFKKFSVNFSKLSDDARKGFVKKINGIFQFDIAGSPYYMDMKAGHGSIAPGNPSTNPDITVVIPKEEDFVALASGKVKGQAAYMKGLFKVKGNMMLGMKLDSLLQTLGNQPASKI